MGPFWGSFFEHFKGCGRERGIATFFAAVGVIIVVFFAGLAIGASQLDKYMGTILLVLGLWAATWCVVAFRRAWLYRRQRLGLSRLSSDELAKARSKLKNGFAAMHRFQSVKPAPRVPDTDLKY